MVHLAQFGAQKGRSIADTFCFSEKAALHCVFFTYPTLRRYLLWQVLRASGMPESLEHVVESILAPMKADYLEQEAWGGFVLWSRDYYRWPVLALHPWVRYCSVTAVLG
eukprot:3810583-Amphidinium_carterae.3